MAMTKAEYSKKQYEDKTKEIQNLQMELRNGNPTESRKREINRKIKKLNKEISSLSYKPGQETQTTESTYLENAMNGTQRNIANAMSTGVENENGSMRLSDNSEARETVKNYDNATDGDESNGEVQNKEQLNELQNVTTQQATQTNEENKEESSNVTTQQPTQTVEENKPKEGTIEKDKPEESKEPESKKKARLKTQQFLELWSGTHPTLFNAIFGKSVEKGGTNPLSYGQRVALLGSALANIGQNAVLGMQAGFNHQSFTPIESEWTKNVNKYMEQGVESTLKKEQEAKGDILAKSSISDLIDEKGEDWLKDVFENASKYSDNPEAFDSYLKNQGLASRKDDIIKAYASNKFSQLDEQTKQMKLDTIRSQYAADIDRLDSKQRDLLDKYLTDAKKMNLMYETKNAKNQMDTNTFKIYEDIVGKTLGDVSGIAGKFFTSDENLKDFVKVGNKSSGLLKAKRKPFTVNAIMKKGESIANENDEKRKDSRNRCAMQSQVNSLISQSLASNSNVQPMTQQTVSR